MCNTADRATRPPLKRRERRTTPRRRVWVAHNLVGIGAVLAWLAVGVLLITKIGLVLRMTTLFSLGVAITTTIVSVLLWAVWRLMPPADPITAEVDRRFNSMIDHLRP